MNPNQSNFDLVVDSPLEGFVGQSSAMRRIFQLTRMSAQCDSSVLVLGETGTGKSIIANELHRLSNRSQGPMVVVNCSKFDDDLLAIELFGEERTSESETPIARIGRLEAAHGGTIVLEEIASISATTQIKLLEFLRNRKNSPPGNGPALELDVRIISTCCLDLNLEVVQGRFREDLFWQLNVIPIALPPLRRRDGDVALLISHFVERIGRQLGKPDRRIEPTALKALNEYAWPGNGWELQNYLERAIVLSQSCTIEASLFPVAVMGDAKAAQVAVFRPADDQSLIREFVHSRLSKSESDARDLFKQIVDPVEKELLDQIMTLCNQTQTAAAKKLGINRNTLHKKLTTYGLVKAKSIDAVGNQG